MAKRLWRLRKLHQYVDAELAEPAGAEVELRLFYNGDLAYVRRTTRADALDEAALKRAALERDGWTFHW